MSVGFWQSFLTTLKNLSGKIYYPCPNLRPLKSGFCILYSLKKRAKDR
jgi:hypothetical protein